MDTILYFDEVAHKYTDNLGNTFTSATQLISKYYEHFDAEGMARSCAKIGRNPNHPKYLKYRGKTEKQLLAEWKKETEVACAKGTAKHDYLERGIKLSNNYKLVEGKYIKGQLFTVPAIKHNPAIGEIQLSTLITYGLDKKYPEIFNVIAAFVSDGWRIYAEIGVFNLHHLVSGLIDLLLIKGDVFFIIDWKTNKAPIRFESGYYGKDTKGNILLTEFITTDKRFLYPLNHLPESTGHKYSLQLSLYAYLVETFGYTCAGMLLCHIRTIPDDSDVVELVKIDYYKSEIEAMLNHHTSNQIRNKQTKLFI